MPRAGRCLCSFMRPALLRVLFVMACIAMHVALSLLALQACVALVCIQWTGEELHSKLCDLRLTLEPLLGREGATTYVRLVPNLNSDLRRGAQETAGIINERFR